MSNFFRRGSAAIMAAVMVLALAGCNNGNESSDSGSAPAESTVPDANSTAQSSSNENSDAPSNAPDKFTNPASTKELSDSVKTIRNGAILHTFAWSFKTITESMADIAYAGYSAIQTSPINECVVGGDGGMQLYGEGKWYYHYQPTDWKIGNYQLGTKEEFTEMCAKAHEYGIKVIVDVVPNHTTSSLEDVSADFIEAVGGADKLYHAHGKVDVNNYNDRLDTTTGAVGGVPDVNTENPAFQDYFIKYLNECIACGADGFRYDTAKHIGLPDDPTDPNSEKNNFWERVITEIDNAEDIFNYGETLQGEGDRTADYQEAIGGTTASDYGKRIRGYLSSGTIDPELLSKLAIDYDDPTAVTWVESHDNYNGDNTDQIDKKLIILGWAMIGSRANGTPLFFSRPYDSSNSSKWGTMNRIGAAGDPFYKDPTVVAVNRFRTAMIGEDETFSTPGSEKCTVMIERGSKGAVLVNVGQYSVDISTPTSLPDGEYENRIDGKTDKFKVENGIITGTIDGKSAVVLYNEGYTEVAAIPTVKAETSSFILSDKAVSVNLHAENADEATYSLNGGEATAYTDGTEIEVGEGAEAGDVITLTLHAKNAGGETTMTYYFTVQGNRSISVGTKIYFNKPDDWADKVNAYVYFEDSAGNATQGAAWPGVECTLEDDGRYSYTFDKDWESVLVIFNDGTNQLPATMEPGWVVVPDGEYPS